MKIFVLTLFPEYFLPLVSAGVVGQLLQGKRKNFAGKIQLEVINIREFSHTNYQSVDDAPYGGGAGMVMRPDVLSRALREGVWERYGLGAKDDNLTLIKEKLHVIMTTPRGQVWTHQSATEMAQLLTIDAAPLKSLVFICGRYEGADERFVEKYVDDSFSIGDFILSGGEIAALAMLDSLIRFIPGTLGNEESLKEESFTGDLLEYPQYTRPQNFEGLPVPEILCNGDHAKIKKFQMEKSLEVTKKFRPDLFQKYNSQFSLDESPKN
ncbi:MAG: tRNA (guanosine(37)-N1)-methyltransferase TrmD [Bacteriovoracaceae bacterium]|nr:tRNA (guanosine(37)-N1)-methyltransferase TrmD [Bacteriovoracaceae bacterium]